MFNFYNLHIIKFNKLIILISVFMFFGCKNDNYVYVTLNNDLIGKDSIIIKERNSERTIATLSPEVAEHKIKLESPTIAAFSTKNEKAFYLYNSILIPGKKILLSLDTLNTLSSNDLGDSLLIYLWRNNNEFNQKNSNLLWGEFNPVEVSEVYKKHKEHRDSVLIGHKENLSKTEIEALLFENSARIDGLLLYYGRSHEIDFNDPFYTFINDIDVDNYWNRSFPSFLLYKFEIELARNEKKSDNLVDFLIYIESRISNKDMSDLVKATYIRDLINAPGTWPKMRHLLNEDQIKQAIKKEKNNKYAYLFEQSSISFFGSQKGKTAFNFKAMNLLDEEISLSDYKGKYVLIDVWATWCGACLDNRPDFMAMATKYKGSDEIVFLTLSVDSSIERWRKFIKKEGVKEDTQELLIINGMNTQFGKSYSITTIPRYILIDTDGLIVNANLPSPSDGLESIIEELLAD